MASYYPHYLGPCKSYVKIKNNNRKLLKRSFALVPLDFT